jgi:integrase/recombinase XerD
VVSTRVKTGVPFSVPIPTSVAREILTSPNSHPEYLFWEREDGVEESARKRWTNWIKKVFRTAGMPEGHSHLLRHTFAYDLLSKGVPIEHVSKLLGHSSIKTTEKYYGTWAKGRQNLVDDVVSATWLVSV